jgi:hypothetical protein
MNKMLFDMPRNTMKTSCSHISNISYIPISIQVAGQIYWKIVNNNER